MDGWTELVFEVTETKKSNSQAILLDKILKQYPEEAPAPLEMLGSYTNHNKNCKVFWMLIRSKKQP